MQHKHEGQARLFGIKPCDVRALFFPHDYTREDARALLTIGALEWNHEREELERTDTGAHLARRLRERHGLHWHDDAGGGRWHVGKPVDGGGLHCGNAIEVLMGDGTWLRARFEVEHDASQIVTKGRRPVLYVATTGAALRCRVEDWSSVMVRRPERSK